MQNYDKKVTNEFGDIFYNLNGQLHRLDGPAVEYANGGKSYYVNSQRHRLDGPAVEGANGYKAYYVNDQRHRLDGPAIEYADGNKEYFVNGHHLSESKFNKHPEVVAYRKRQKLLKALE